jgi:hypothetical protein
MDSTTWLIVSSLLLTLAVITVVVLLYLQASRTLQRSYQEARELLASSRANETQQWESLLTATSSMQEEALGKVLETMMSQSTQQQETMTRALSELHSRAMSGNESSLLKVTSLLEQTTRMLGTKDPVAYQMVAGADAVDSEAATKPYTAADEVEQERLDEAMKLLDELTGGAANAGAYAAAESARADYGEFATGFPGSATPR